MGNARVGAVGQAGKSLAMVIDTNILYRSQLSHYVLDKLGALQSRFNEIQIVVPEIVETELQNRIRHDLPKMPDLAPLSGRGDVQGHLDKIQSIRQEEYDLYMRRVRRDFVVAKTTDRILIEAARRASLKDRRVMQAGGGQ